MKDSRFFVVDSCRMFSRQKSLLRQRLGLVDLICWLCKDLVLLFKEYSFSRAVAFAEKWRIQLDNIDCALVVVLVQWCLDPRGLVGSTSLGDSKSLIFVYLFYVL